MERHAAFIYLPIFSRTMMHLGLTDADQQEIENAPLANPRHGAVIPGTGGARKMRIALSGRGKSGGARGIYVYIEAKGRIYMLALYAKNVQGNLTEAQKNAIRTLIRQLETEV